MDTADILGIFRTPATAPRQLGPLAALTEQWLAGWRYAGALSRLGLASFAFVCEARSLRAPWLAALGQAADRYMRSPVFLQSLTYTLRAMAPAPRLDSSFRPR